MKKVIAVLGLITATSSAYADWTLVKDQSSFTFASIKKVNVYEAHTFNSYSGMIDDSGMASLKLDLTSVNTGIEIRDQRMNKMLFDTEKFASADFSAKVDPKVLAGLKPGQRETMMLDGKLALHGMEKAVKAEVNLFRLSENRVLVSTAKPVVVKAGDFALVKGVEALREIAGLPSITTTVPVNFDLVFEHK